MEGPTERPRTLEDLIIWAAQHQTLSDSHWKEQWRRNERVENRLDKVEKDTLDNSMWITKVVGIVLGASFIGTTLASLVSAKLVGN